MQAAHDRKPDAPEPQSRARGDKARKAGGRKLVGQVSGAFQYLEDRFTDNCAAPYACKEQHRRASLAY